MEEKEYYEVNISIKSAMKKPQEYADSLDYR